MTQTHAALTVAVSLTKESIVALMAMMKRLNGIIEELEDLFPDSEVSLDLDSGSYNELTITIKLKQELENVK
jgi:hypothetical protein